MGGGVMKKKKPFLIRYLPLVLSTLGFVVFSIVYPQFRGKAFYSLKIQLTTMLMVIPPIFLLLGLLDVWAPRELFIRLMGENSGIRGNIIAFIFGSVGVGPLYGAFPVAAVLMKKGASFSNILIFIGAWSTTKIPMLLFEMQSVGLTFALARLAIDIPGIIIISLAVKATVPKKDVEKAYQNAIEHT